ncbi:DUF7706 family protein [Pseudomonas putida]
MERGACAIDDNEAYLIRADVDVAKLRDALAGSGYAPH